MAASLDQLQKSCINMLPGLILRSDSFHCVLSNHPAFHSRLRTEVGAEECLMGCTPMTYLLWIMGLQYCLSYMETDLKIEHRAFTYDGVNFNWNLYSSKKIELLIPIMMKSRPERCKILKSSDLTV